MDHTGPIKLLSHQQTTPHNILTSPFPCWEGYVLKEHWTTLHPLPSHWRCIPQLRTLGALLTWKAAALKGKVAGLAAGAPVDTGGGRTRHVGTVAVLACEALGALALIGTREVEAGAPVLALPWNVTLIDVSLTFLPREACEACAGELVGHSGAGTSICTGVGQAGISPLAQFTYRKDNRRKHCPQKWVSAPSHPTSPTQQVI